MSLYAGIGNNPVNYIDPDGEFFLGTIFTYTIDFIKTAFFKGGLDITSKKAMGKAWKDFDPTAPWSQTNKAWKIDIGGFKGTYKQTLSRWTWELPQTLIGKSYSHYANITGQVSGVDYYDGATVIKCYGDNIPLSKTSLGATHGSFIIGNNKIEATPSNWLFQHEYGHYLQSQSSGWFYYSKYGIPSAMSKNDTYHYLHPAEQDANIRAFQYFSKHVNGFNWVNKYGIQMSNWDRWENPINGYNWYLPYTDNANQEALRHGRLSLAWYDYLMAPLNFTFIGITIPGLINAHILNNQY